MAAEPMREIVVEAVLNDPYDGAIRLLGDAQRFGFELRSLGLAMGEDGATSAVLVLRVPASVDPQLAAVRLARHPVVQRADAWANPGETSYTYPQAAAA